MYFTWIAPVSYPELPLHPNMKSSVFHVDCSCIYLGVSLYPTLNCPCILPLKSSVFSPGLLLYLSWRVPLYPTLNCPCILPWSLLYFHLDCFCIYPGVPLYPTLNCPCILPWSLLYFTWIAPVSTLNCPCILPWIAPASYPEGFCIFTWIAPVSTLDCPCILS